MFERLVVDSGVTGPFYQSIQKMAQWIQFKHNIGAIDYYLSRT